MQNIDRFIAGSSLVPYQYANHINKKQEKLAIQLYSVDKEMHEDAKSTLTLLKKIGYKYVEHAGYRNSPRLTYSHNTPAGFI